MVFLTYILSLVANNKRRNKIYLHYFFYIRIYIPIIDIIWTYTTTIYTINIRELTSIITLLICILISIYSIFSAQFSEIFLAVFFIWVLQKKTLRTCFLLRFDFFNCMKRICVQQFFVYSDSVFLKVFTTVLPPP